MSSTQTITDPTTWALDREIVLVRVLEAPRQAVFAAWTDADAFCQWFGPEGFTCTVREMDARPGGRASFDMVAEDGTVYTIAVVPDERLVMDHGSDADDDPARFRVTVTLDEQADGETVLNCDSSTPPLSSETQASPSARSSSVSRRCRSSLGISALPDRAPTAPPSHGPPVLAPAAPNGHAPVTASRRRSRARRRAPSSARRHGVGRAVSPKRLAETLQMLLA